VCLVSFCSFLICVGVSIGNADGPADNNPEAVRAVPPPGMDVPAEARQKLLERANAIDAQLAGVGSLDSLSRSLVSVFPRAVRMTVATNMFYKDKEVDDAETLLDEAERRLDLLRKGVRGTDLFGIADAARWRLPIGTRRINATVRTRIASRLVNSSEQAIATRCLVAWAWRDGQ
jgi:hypothetical protein